MAFPVKSGVIRKAAHQFEIRFIFQFGSDICRKRGEAVETEVFMSQHCFSVFQQGNICLINRFTGLVISSIDAAAARVLSVGQ